MKLGPLDVVLKDAPNRLQFYLLYYLLSKMGQLVNNVESVVSTQKLRINFKIAKVEPIQLIDGLWQLGIFQDV